ncbi:MAG TPA: hypothetical protein PLU50_08750 [Pseudobdellovibrionaceae bacterium]|nr:hypothetical protein [Pseudobdellovibrionaceae bacterium]
MMKVSPKNIELMSFESQKYWGLLMIFVAMGMMASQSAVAMTLAPEPTPKAVPMPVPPELMNKPDTGPDELDLCERSDSEMASPHKALFELGRLMRNDPVFLGIEFFSGRGGSGFDIKKNVILDDILRLCSKEVGFFEFWMEEIYRYNRSQHEISITSPNSCSIITLHDFCLGNDPLKTKTRSKKGSQFEQLKCFATEADLIMLWASPYCRKYREIDQNGGHANSLP